MTVTWDPVMGNTVVKSREIPCGRGLAPMAASGPTRLLCRSRSKCGRGLAPDGGLRADQDVGSDRVHIRFCGNGHLGFRPYGGSLLKSAKVSKTLLPHHSAPRLGSVCPLSGLNPWAAAMGHPWPSAANPASCRVAHGFKPAFGQRGLTGRLRSRSRSKADQEQERLASHRGYGWALQSCVGTYGYRGQAPPTF